MTEREKHIEMAQRLGLVGMRPHLDGIYIDALAAFAKLVADDARATPALPQGGSTNFSDQSTATAFVKAARFLESLSGNDTRYFYDDGYPRLDDIRKDAAASLLVLQKLTPALPQGVEEVACSPTKGMNLGERIAHVGGRENEAGYIEFGSVMAVDALINHILRDIRFAAKEKQS